jgi:hypothetical protein
MTGTGKDGVEIVRQDHHSPVIQSLNAVKVKDPGHEPESQIIAHGNRWPSGFFLFVYTHRQNDRDRDG